MKLNARIMMPVLCICLLFGSSLSAGETNKQAPPSGHLAGVRVLGSISSQYGTVSFDHAKHMMLADTCSACHHHGSGDTSSCAGCHGIKPAMFKRSLVQTFMPCSNCHSTHDKDYPAMPGLKVAYHMKCFACHRGMGNLGLDPSGCTTLCHAK